MLDGVSLLVMSSSDMDTGNDVLADSKFKLYNKRTMASHISGAAGRARGFRRGTRYTWSQALLFRVRISVIDLCQGVEHSSKAGSPNHTSLHIILAIRRVYAHAQEDTEQNLEYIHCYFGDYYCFKIKTNLGLTS